MTDTAETKVQTIADVREAEADSIIRRYALFATGAGMIPIPGLDVAAAAGVKFLMVKDLAALYQVPFQSATTKAVISSVASAGIGRLLVELIDQIGDSIPGMKNFSNGLTGGAICGLMTAEEGQVYKMHFMSGGNIEDMEVQQFFAHVETQFRDGNLKPSKFATMQGQFSYLF